MFGTIYDRVFNIYSTDFPVIFSYFFKNGFYIMLGMIFILIPLTFFTIFYYLWMYPYGRWWHWLIWLFISLSVVFGCTFGYANSFILNSNAPDMISCYNLQQCSDYVNTLPIQYAKANFILSIISGFIWSLILKQFSKVQTHLPF